MSKKQAWISNTSLFIANTYWVVPELDTYSKCSLSTYLGSFCANKIHSQRNAGPTSFGAQKTSFSIAPEYLKTRKTFSNASSIEIEITHPWLFMVRQRAVFHCLSPLGGRGFDEGNLPINFGLEKFGNVEHHGEYHHWYQVLQQASSACLRTIHGLVIICKIWEKNIKALHGGILV